MPFENTEQTKFIALANVIIKRHAPREYHFSKEWEYTITGEIPTYLEVWKRNDPNRTGRPYIITLLPQVSEWVKETLGSFIASGTA